jgi:hypothetical protein
MTGFRQRVEDLLRADACPCEYSVDMRLTQSCSFGQHSFGKASVRDAVCQDVQDVLARSGQGNETHALPGYV